MVSSDNILSMVSKVKRRRKKKNGVIHSRVNPQSAQIIHTPICMFWVRRPGQTSLSWERRIKEAIKPQGVVAVLSSLILPVGKCLGRTTVAHIVFNCNIVNEGSFSHAYTMPKAEVLTVRRKSAVGV